MTARRPAAPAALSAACALALLVALAPSTAAAQAAPRERAGAGGALQRPYRVNLAVDLTVTGAAATAWIVPQLLLPSLVAPSCPCARGDVIPIDRWAAGRRDDVAARVSDVAVALTVGGPLVLDALDVWIAGAPWTEAAEDVLVIAQAALLSGAVNQLAKVGFRRPRPLLVGLPAGDHELEDRENYLSFYSAHTSTAFAMGMAYASTYARRHPRSPWVPVVYGGAAAYGALVGALRVVAGRHYPTDVTLGALFGAAFGLVVPALHARGGAARVSFAPTHDGAALLVAGTLP